MIVRYYLQVVCEELIPAAIDQNSIRSYFGNFSMREKCYLMTNGLILIVVNNRARILCIIDTIAVAAFQEPEVNVYLARRTVSFDKLEIFIDKAKGLTIFNDADQLGAGTQNPSFREGTAKRSHLWDSFHPILRTR